MSAVLHAAVTGWGLCAPGLDDAAAFADWLRDPTRALPGGHSARPAAACMAPAEHRRAPHAVRLALEAATQALGTHHATSIGAVFCSAFGDMANTDVILSTLAQTPDQVSPTRFTHSVHNAAAGHWSMAAASHASMSALACGREGIGPALLAALLEVRASAAPQLLVLFDARMLARWPTPRRARWISPSRCCWRRLSTTHPARACMRACRRDTRHPTLRAIRVCSPGMRAVPPHARCRCWRFVWAPHRDASPGRWALARCYLWTVSTHLEPDSQRSRRHPDSRAQ
ncbi:hypothetical protein B1B_15074 [mine drainage metagenome]|uniref:Beta-ketoacyl synthase-like N-terminal domain-containing protein n=1 Tax=mine drainage metagenome TaxID=410659 RepID=T0Z506_9ZZZZ